MENERYENKKSSKKGCLLGCLITGIIFVAVIATLVCVGLSYYNDISSGIVNKNQEKGVMYEEIDFTVENGASTKAIAQDLKKEGLIDSVYAFLYLCEENGLSAAFHPGTYQLNNYMDFYAITDMLQNPNTDTEHHTFTVKEGDGVKEIAQNLESAGIVSADDFLEACNSRDYDFDFIADIPERDNLLEGYLFPDTYYFDLDATSEDIINKMLSRFDEVFSAEYRQQAKSIGRSLDEIVIIASVIEGEVRYPDERATVASVIYNRLEAGMRLQMDATVLYALGEKKERVLYEDLEIEDGHNTYVVDGLPVGPIGNPGADCIKAALYPEETDYLYYVLEDVNSGKHYFTSDYNSFTNASNNYRKGFDN